MKHRNWRVAMLLFVLFSFVFTPFAFSEIENDKALAALLKEQPGLGLIASKERDALLPKEIILKTLKIKPGMIIADIGAGIGTFTFPLADALQKTGLVYATDIVQADLDYIQAKAQRDGYNNISAVRVNPRGPNKFYHEHTFDIIFVCDLLAFIEDMEDFVHDLWPSLKKGTGRFYILEPREVSYLHDVDFGDFKPLVSALERANPNLPIIKKLSPAVKDFLATWNNTEVPAGIRTQILRDLNALLDDRSFTKSLIDYFVSDAFPKDENEPWPKPLMETLGLDTGRYIKLLITELDARGAFDKKDVVLSGREAILLRKLNKALIVGILHIDIRLHGLEQTFATIILHSKESIIAKMEAAGYTLVTDHDFLPKYYFLEFKKADSETTK